MTHDRAKGTLKLGLLIRSQRLTAEDTQRSDTIQLKNKTSKYIRQTHTYVFKLAGP